MKGTADSQVRRKRYRWITPRRRARKKLDSFSRTLKNDLLYHFTIALREEIMERKKVLIIDDSTVTRKSLRDFFTALHRFDIHEAENAEEGYNGYRKILPDLVTMDITMKGMNGVELTRRIMEDYPSAKIIMVSATDQQEMVVQALRFGAKNYIIKPFDENKLTAIVDSLV